LASEITKNGGICHLRTDCAYDSTRKECGRWIEPFAGSILVHLSTPVEFASSATEKGL